MTGKTDDRAQIFVGVDGGATKTRVVVGDGDGTVLAEGTGGPTNFQVVGTSQAGANLASALTAAMTSISPAACHTPRVARMTVGMAGLDSAADVPPIRTLLEQALAACGLETDWQVVNDAVIAWAGALGGQAGGIVISGSGAAALAVNSRRQLFHADGLGHWLGDDGSGFEIGRNGLRAAVRAQEGRGPETLLVGPLLRLCGGNVSQWAARLTADGALAHREMAQFAPEVVQAAAAADPVALAVLIDAGRALAETAGSVLRRAGLADAVSNDPAPVATIGSLFVHAKPLRAAFCGKMTALLPNCQVIWPRQQPAEGALILARSPDLLPENVLAVRNPKPINHYDR
ncbi:MAG: BadF/BadG/BcrA/BcrD ATPase family protein [Caldilineaceae bacterium]